MHMQIPCNGISIGLDSSAGDLPFLSHAHADHTSGLKRKPEIISTPETLELAMMKSKRVSVPGTTLINAGHILGSRQLVVEEDGKKTVYTGDISIKPNIFGFKAEIPECDRLIMEATYGDPSYVFPDYGEVVDSIFRFVKENDSRNIIIGAYNLGKAQEIVRMLNECSIAPVISEKADHFCSVYDKYGVHLDHVVVGTDEAEEVMSGRFVGVVPMNKAKRYFAHRMSEAFERDTLCAVATGWALHYRFNVDAAFPLSDHADFNDLVHFVEQSGAKEVEFFCGDGSKVLSAARKALLNNQ
jgi:putative mRNA 3-end processing factor